MAVYFKFKSAKDIGSIPMIDPFISVRTLKQRIVESKRFGFGNDFDLAVVNSQTNEEYFDDSTLIAQNTSVLISRVSGIRCLPIVIGQNSDHEIPIVSQEVEFGDDVYASAVIPDNTVTIRNRERPPKGYVCHRCNVPGHFIQHCPTNGDPNYDVIKTSSVREIEGLRSTSSGFVRSRIPQELHCSLCKEVMRCAVMTSKCCFQSFCDECIKKFVMSKSVCVCGFRDIAVDDLVPNMAIRDTITRYLESDKSSCEVTGHSSQVLQPKILSPIQASASKGDKRASHVDVENPPKGMKKAALQSEGQLKLASSALGKVKKRKNICLASNAVDMQGNANAIPMHPYWNVMPYMGYEQGLFDMPFSAQPYMAHTAPSQMEKKRKPYSYAVDCLWT